MKQTHTYYEDWTTRRKQTHTFSHKTCTAATLDTESKFFGDIPVKVKA